MNVDIPFSVGESRSLWQPNRIVLPSCTPFVVRKGGPLAVYPVQNHRVLLDWRTNRVGVVTLACPTVVDECGLVSSIVGVDVLDGEVVSDEVLLRENGY